MFTIENFLLAGCPRPGFRTWDASGLVEKRNLRRVPRKAFPVHVDTMPAKEIDRLVIPMAASPRVDFSVAGRATPRGARATMVGRDALVVLRHADGLSE